MVGDFHTKVEATAYCKTILQDATKGHREMALTLSERTRLTAIFRGHPDPKVSHADSYGLEWREDGWNGARWGGGRHVGFYAETDGVRTVFSYKNAINGAYNATVSLRNSVQEQMKQFRTKAGAQRPDEHADHIEPFTDLVARWELATGYSRADCVGKNRDELLRDFADFHAREARLRLISAEENQLRGSNPLS